MPDTPNVFEPVRAPALVGRRNKEAVQAPAFHRQPGPNPSQSTVVKRPTGLIEATAQRVARRADKFVHDLGVRIAAQHDGAFYQSTPDRVVLECQILPFYQLSPAHNTLVFVGAEWYTYGYARMFAHKRFSTIDISPTHARHGARRHVTAPMQEMGEHFFAQSMDVVFCNGVFGWGIDTIEDGQKALAAVKHVLRPGGHLVLGWNALDDHMPFDIPRLADAAGFTPIVLPCLGASHIEIDSVHQHRFDTFEWPALPERVDP